MNHKAAIFICFLICTAFISCKKQEIISQSKTSLLTEKHWLFSSFLLKFSAAEQWQDGLAQLQDCEKDDRLFFKSDGNYIAEEGASKCYTSDPSVKATGTWTIVNNETEIILQRTGGTSGTYKIELLDNSTFKISYSSPNYYEVATFRH